MENFDLEEIHLKYKDLSKIFQQQSYPFEHPSHENINITESLMFTSIIHTFFFLSFVYYIYFNDVCVCVFMTN